MTQALITPEIVRWARERKHLTTEAAAKKLRIKPDTLVAWEYGDARPTLRQAQTLAHRFNIPFGYLFLSSPPQERLPLPDLRTVAGEQPRAPSPDFSDLLNDVLLKQQWYREYQQEEEDAEPIPFIGRFTLDDDAEEIAEDIRITLGINEGLRQESANWEEFLRKFIRRAEKAGVLVMRSGIVGNNTHRKLSVDEFRGFAISDDFAPLVFINGQDAKAAQIFTLAHEMSHLWIGESGVSNPDFRRSSSQQNNNIERLCNRAAAEILLPKLQFLSNWDDNTDLETNLQVIAIRFRVSSLAVLRQAYDLDLLTSSVYWDQYDQQTEKHRNRESRTTTGGGDFYASLLARNSNTLTEALMVATAEGRVLHRDAAQLLNVKVKTLNGISERLFKENLFSG